MLSISQITQHLVEHLNPHVPVDNGPGQHIVDYLTVSELFVLFGYEEYARPVRQLSPHPTATVHDERHTEKGYRYITYSGENSPNGLVTLRTQVEFGVNEDGDGWVCLSAPDVCEEHHRRLVTDQGRQEITRRNGSMSAGTDEVEIHLGQWEFRGDPSMPEMFEYLVPCWVVLEGRMLVTRGLKEAYMHPRLIVAYGRVIDDSM